jgi:hypothetical protein
MIDTPCSFWQNDRCAVRGPCLNDRPAVITFYMCPTSEARRRREEAEFAEMVKAANLKVFP